MAEADFLRPLRSVPDRSPRDAGLAFAGAWLALVTGLLIGGEAPNAAVVAVVAVVGAVVVFLGLAAASRTRPFPLHTPSRRVRLAFLAAAIGVALGLANLAANLLIATLDPAIRALLAERFATLHPLVGIVAAPLVEEVGLRLFLMSAIAWIVWRPTRNATLAFVLALWVSALLFALLHLDRPMPADATVALWYRVALVAKYTLAGVPLGWVYWRWGLPYAILCHSLVNTTHLVLQERAF